MSSSPCWSDLPYDLLRGISSRLHAASDYVRFHAACKSWRDTLPPPAHRPAFLPWILSWRDAKGYRKARCIFSGVSSYVPDRRWAISADDGVAACCLSLTTSLQPNNSSADPFTGAATSIVLPPYWYPTTSWVNQASGMVSSDGTALVYAWCLRSMALLSPGDLDWRFVNKSDFNYYAGDTDCVVYHDGKIVRCCGSSWHMMSTLPEARRRWVAGMIQDEYGREVQASYLVQSRGELLLVLIQVKTNSRYYTDRLKMHLWMYRWPPADGDDSDIGRLLDALLVSVYVLRYRRDDEPHWLRKTNASLADRTFFLGRQVSFAVDADRFGMGGCAYFVDRRDLCSGPWGTPPVNRHRVFKYSFGNHSSELVEQLPLHWNYVPCTWLTPNPAIASNEEIREKLKV